VLVVDGEAPGATLQSFRTYQVRRMIDVKVAAMAVQHNDLFPGIDPRTRSHLSTIISELGTNIVKYAGSGRILLRALERSGDTGIEVVSVDEGPGIPDLDQALEDHFTTGKTLGLGLGSVRRLATDFEISCPDSGGTRVRAVCWWPTNRSSPATDAAPTTAGDAARTLLRRRRAEREAASADSAADQPVLQLTSVSENRPALGQTVSGDALIVLDHGQLGFRIALDGAGHGPIAHELASRAAAVIRQHLEAQIEALPLTAEGLVPLNRSGIDELMLETARVTHSQTRGSRGVAFGMAVFDSRAHRLHYLGIGNTRILKLNWKGWEGVNRDGQLGVSYKTPQVNHYPLAPGDLVIQSSDGIKSSALRAQRAGRPGSELDPAKIIQTLLRSTSFDDDVSILMTRCHV